MLFRSPDCLASALALSLCLSEGELPSRHPLEDAGILAGRVPPAFSLRRATEQWSRELERIETPAPKASPKAEEPLPRRLARALLMAYPDRVVRVLSGGDLAESALSGSLEVHPELRGGRGLAIELEAQERQLLRQGERHPPRPGDRRSLPVIESWAPIPEEWLLDLDPSLISESESAAWDEQQKRVDRKSTRLNSSHVSESRMPSSA